MQTTNIINEHLPQIQKLMRQYRVQQGYAFGSAVKNTMHKHSDVDFLIRFPEDLDFQTYTDNYFALLYDLENLLNRQVDLVAEETLVNPFLIQSIDSHKVRVI